MKQAQDTRAQVTADESSLYANGDVAAQTRLCEMHR